MGIFPITKPRLRRAAARAVRLLHVIKSRRSLAAAVRAQPTDIRAWLALIDRERSDVHEPDDVRCVLAQGGHDLAAVRVPGDDGGAGLECENLAEPSNVNK